MATGANVWSRTAATNATADSAVNWAEGQAPSSVNDSARAMMASVAMWIADSGSGGNTTGGTSTAYTLTSKQGFASLTAMDGRRFTVFFHTACGATPTLAVDGLTAKTIKNTAYVALAANDIATNASYDMFYDNSNNAFVMIGKGAGTGFAAGTTMIFAQTAAPTGWTKSALNDDHALRLTTGTASTGGSTAFTSIFASRTILQGNLPSYNLSSASLTATFTGTPGQVTGSGTSTATTPAGATTVVTGNSGVAAGTVAVGGTVPSGGSGTAMDFAVKYVDVIRAAKD
jgi:hypothetical protein